jgi:hypothetical protein
MCVLARIERLVWCNMLAGDDCLRPFFPASQALIKGHDASRHDATRCGTVVGIVCSIALVGDLTCTRAFCCC